MSQPFAINESLHLLKHPFYQAWVEGRLSREALQDYVGQYYHHVKAFPRYLENAYGVSADEGTKAILADHLAEEDGTTHGTSHPELWLRFAEGVGVGREQVESAALRRGVTALVDTFEAHSKASLPRALGALYAYESQVPEVAHSKIEGLKRHFAVTDERTLSFFEVHKVADVEHRESLRALIERLPAAEQEEARKAADSACQALWDFLSDVPFESQCA